MNRPIHTLLTRTGADYLDVARQLRSDYLAHCCQQAWRRLLAIRLWLAAPTLSSIEQ